MQEKPGSRTIEYNSKNNKNPMRKKNSSKNNLQRKILLIIILPLIFTNIPFISALHYNHPVFPTSSLTERNEEVIDRGLVAVNNSDGDIYLSWRLLQDDPDEITFNVYKNNATQSSVKLNSNPISQTTDFSDENQLNQINLEYWVVPLIGGVPGAASEKVQIFNDPENNYFSIDLQGNYTAAYLNVGDLNGDGKYDYIVKSPNTGTDPANGAWHPADGTHTIEAYLSNGTLLWTYDMGWDIEKGSWYGPIVVWDLDSDGKAEVIVKSGEGDHRDLEGRVASGPEYVKVLNGLTGEEITRAPWISRWYGTYKNLARNQMGIAYLDGVNPYIIVARGTYGIMKAKAYSFQNNELTEVWHWESSYEWGYHYYSQGAHTMTCCDVDGDGNDEVILGSCVLDENGNGLWSTGFSHCDLAYVGDIDPNHPGLEIFYSIEGTGSMSIENGYGMCLVDAATGKLLWTSNVPTEHMHGGVVSDITAESDGMECFAAERYEPGRYLFSSDGELLADESQISYDTRIRAVYWDGDIQRELCNYGDVFNFDSDEHYIQLDSSDPVGYMDILGDWREEIITSVNGELRIYTTSIPAEDRRVCLMQDSVYRRDVAHNSMGYPHVPTTSYCLAFPDAEKTPDPDWIYENEVSVSFTAKISGLYRKYNIVLLSYLISLILTGLFLFQENNIKKLIRLLKIPEKQIVNLVKSI